MEGRGLCGLHQLIKRTSERLSYGSGLAEGDSSSALLGLLHDSEWQTCLLGYITLSTARFDACRPDGSRKHQLVRWPANSISRHGSPLLDCRRFHENHAA